MAAGLSALDRPGELDRAAEQQKLFSKGRLASVGMADDGERASPTDLVFEGCRRAQRIST